MIHLIRFPLLRLVSPSFSTSKRLLRGRASDIASSIEQCSTEGDIPTVQATTPDPYEPEKPKCLFCRLNVQVDHKNVRLLSQFVSSFTGRLYEQHVTGLCAHQFHRLREAIKLSRACGYMPVFHKQPRYLKDPKLFDPMKPIRPNPF